MITIHSSNMIISTKTTEAFTLSHSSFTSRSLSDTQMPTWVHESCGLIHCGITCHNKILKATQLSVNGYPLNRPQYTHLLDILSQQASSKKVWVYGIIENKYLEFVPSFWRGAPKTFEIDYLLYVHEMALPGV